MTKEELEKEADDYVANTNTGICELEGIVTIICDGEGNAISADSIAKSAYIAGAEPREKRIAELEAQIETMKEAEQCKPRWHNIKEDGQPPKAGLYLCYRRWHYTDMYELIYWTGEYWVTGSTDYDVIFAWYEIPKFEEG